MIFRHQNFPGKFNFREEASICAKDFSFRVDVDIAIDFHDKISVSTKVFKRTASRKIEKGSHETLGFINQFKNETKIIIPGKLIIFGFFTSIQTKLDSSRNCVESGIFAAYEIISLEFPGYVRYQEDEMKHFLLDRNNEQPNSIRLKVYLSDEFSFKDKYNISESLNVDNNVVLPEVFCLLKSGYLFRCGKSRKSFSSVETVSIDQQIIYKFSFFDLKLEKQNLMGEIKVDGEETNNFNGCADVLKQLELISMKLCDYISIIAGRVIEPIYYEYEVSISGRSINGLMLPVFEHIRLNTNATHWPTQNSSSSDLSSMLEAFLECCPLEERMERGLFNLKSSLSKDYSSGLQILAICSSIEYFFAHWFWGLSGYSFLMNHPDVAQRKKRSMEKNHADGKTPALSTYLKVFLEKIEVIYNHEETLKLLEYRHKILHGGLFSETSEFLLTIQTGRSLSAQIMNSILKSISKSDNTDVYEQIVAAPLISSYLNSSHWLDVESARNELVNFESSEILGKYWSI
ncbi:hypothetical protein PN498_21800 [Oscillatoria sp. CS-180]|uniref:hypothetical protein n=1 Tax=Oscillatoria sp. CS-180 TaxID=3021720 RepID=UPI00232BFCBC|nr:hypothetical protein [Oscillatoria sp. CS-180]MDB9528641.1 hypothetical protein [Oscillatoria sp. CS-180]